MAPDVVEVRRDACHREIRLELADWRTRTGGVHDLSRPRQEALLLEGHLPGWGLFLPDFVIVYATGEPVDATTARWTDLRVHVGGLQWSALQETPKAALLGPDRLASCEWYHVSELRHGSLRTGPAPAWLLDLIRTATPFGHLLDAA